MTTYQGELRAIHARESGPIASALAQIPEYLNAKQMLSTLPAKINVEIDSRHEVDQVLASALAAGQPLNTPEVWLDAAAAHSKSMGFGLVADAADRLRSRLTTELDALVRENSDRLFTVLNDELQGLLLKTREAFDKLDGIHDFEAAYKHGLADEYEALRAAQQEYQRIRSDQYLLTERVTDTNVTGQALRKMHVAHVADLSVDVEHVLAELNVRVNDGTRTREPKSSLPLNWSATEGMWWSLKHPNARTWVPSGSELDAARIRQALQIKAAATWLGESYFTNHRNGFDKSKFSELQAHLAGVRATASV